MNKILYTYIKYTVLILSSIKLYAQNASLLMNEKLQKYNVDTAPVVDVSLDNGYRKHKEAQLSYSASLSNVRPAGMSYEHPATEDLGWL